jgi:hypothetical protein
MRSILIMAMFVTSLAFAAAGGYQEVRELSLETSGVGTLSISAGSGELVVVGVPGSSEIMVTATIEVDTGNSDKARKKIDSDMVLRLEKERETAVLKAYFDEGGFSWGADTAIHLEVRMPEGLDLAIDDGSGSLEVSNVHGNIKLDDGSGSITLTDVGGTVEIEDGSGSIVVDRAGGNLAIDDGSGSITVRGVAGSVVVDDGSGGIDVSDIDQDLIIVDDGSGSLNVSDVRGHVKTED